MVSRGRTASGATARTSSGPSRHPYGEAAHWPDVTLLEQRLRNPPHLGSLEGATAVGAVGNPACGDVVTLYLRIEDGRIHAAGFESMGSAYQLATASVLCDCVQGLTVKEARDLGPGCVETRLPDLPQKVRYLSRLAIEALGRALDAHDRGEPGDDEEARNKLRILGREEAEKFVLGLLGNGRQWTTRELDAMAFAEGVQCPDSTVRFLSQLRRQGRIEGRMSMQHKSWLWWVPAPGEASTPDVTSRRTDGS